MSFDDTELGDSKLDEAELHDRRLDLRAPDFNQEGTMPAVAEVLPRNVSRRPAPRERDLPTCPVCADSMVAAEASVFLAEHSISYLWSCDTCGYGFVTKHVIQRFACN
jgi:ribosomal protein S27AE